IVGKEGCSTKAILHADIVVNDIFDAFKIISHPKQLIATLKE
ncbi:MAG: HAD family hydrolase, partial [Flavobacteriales bacterium]